MNTTNFVSIQNEHNACYTWCHACSEHNNTMWSQTVNSKQKTNHWPLKNFTNGTELNQLPPNNRNTLLGMGVCNNCVTPVTSVMGCLSMTLFHWKPFTSLWFMHCEQSWPPSRKWWRCAQRQTIYGSLAMSHVETRGSENEEESKQRCVSYEFIVWIISAFHPPLPSHRLRCLLTIPLTRVDLNIMRP